MVAALFIFSFLFTPLFLLMVLVLIFTFCNAMMIGHWRQHIIFLAAIAIASFVLYGASMTLFDEPLTGYASLVITVLIAIAIAAIYAFRKNIAAIFLSSGFFIGSMIFVPTADKIFESVLQPHQKLRILSFLGIMSDPKGADYNVNQAKIAIGSGGLFGKGFMEGTQNKYFVPEKETDFIEVVCWKNTAEFVSKYFGKGRVAIVAGRLQIRNWTDKDGNKRKTAEVLAENVYFGDSKNEAKTQQETKPSEPLERDYPVMTDDDYDLPF